MAKKYKTKYSLKMILPWSTKIDELKERINFHKLTLTSDFTKKNAIVLKKKDGAESTTFVKVKYFSFTFTVEGKWKSIEDFVRYYVRDKGFEVSINILKELEE